MYEQCPAHCILSDLSHETAAAMTEDAAVKPTASSVHDMRSVWCTGIQEEASSSSMSKSEAQLLEEGLNKAIKQLLLALGMPKLATGDWQAIIQAGGTRDTGG